MNKGISELLTRYFALLDENKDLQHHIRQLNFQLSAKENVITSLRGQLEIHERSNEEAEA